MPNPQLWVFGRESHIMNLALEPDNFAEHGTARIAGFETTKFGCRTYELRRQAPAAAVAE
jgi:hypothetical protein